MVNFRHLTITNEANTEKFDLNDFDGCLMTSPTGFGIYRTSEYTTIGNQRVRTNNRATFQKITFTVTILGERNDWEVKYASLRDFISRNIKSGFRLYYTPHEETRYIKCDINIVDKTEKDRANLPIRFEVQPLSLWLTDEQKDSVQQEADTDNLFAFNEQDETTDDYNRPFYSANFELVEDLEDDYERPVYSISFGVGSLQVATLTNSGTETTPLKIKLYGLAVNPFITLKQYGRNNVIQSVKFNNLTVPEDYYLEIDADATNTHIELVDNSTGERFDRSEYADIETNMYLLLPIGRYNLEVSDESGLNKCYAEVFYANQYYGG